MIPINIAASGAGLRGGAVEGPEGAAGEHQLRRRRLHEQMEHVAGGGLPDARDMNRCTLDLLYRC